MDDRHLDDLIEAMADGSHALSAAEHGHLEACVRCRTALDAAREIEQLLQARAVPAPPATFTNAVMLRIGQERWRAERALDAGFNFAMLAGSLVILAGAAGLAWSLGMLTVTIDLGMLWQVLDTGVTGRVLSQVQTLAVASALLTMTLVVWWWVHRFSTD